MALRPPTDVRETGGRLTALGFVGITITTGLYALAPPAAGLPVHPFIAADAIAATLTGAAILHTASLVGVTSDVVATMGVGLILLDLGRRDKGLAAAGMAAILVSILMFTGVDALVGTVLVPLAADPATAMAYIGQKRLFDALFLFGSLAFGLGALLVFAGETASPAYALGRTTKSGVLVSGILALIASAACLAGLPLHLLLGAAVGTAGVVFTLVGRAVAK
jgi:hypothetical protein